MNADRDGLMEKEKEAETAMTALPLVSIVIPSFKPAYFEQTLRSALGQTYGNLEVIVSDNCPTEAIREICEKYNGVKYRRSAVYRTDNLVAALFSAGGKYVKPLFDDDILHPFCIERMVAEMERNEQVQLVFSTSCVIDADNARLRIRAPFDGNTLIPHRDFVRQTVLNFDNFVGEFSSVMFRASARDRLGRENLLKWQGRLMDKGLTDVVFFLNIASGGQYSYLAEELTYFRYDRRTLSNSNPAVNPHFGDAASDWIDILLLAESAGLVSFAEVRKARSRVRNLFKKHGRFPQVAAAVDTYYQHVGGDGLFGLLRPQTQRKP
jgi:glycosyltransferase involved in cell wall biosynthesis